MQSNLLPSPLIFREEKGPGDEFRENDGNNFFLVHHTINLHGSVWILDDIAVCAVIVFFRRRRDKKMSEPRFMGLS